MTMGGKINILVAPPVKLITAIITIMFGGSAGKEGPCVQIGQVWLLLWLMF